MEAFYLHRQMQGKHILSIEALNCVYVKEWGNIEDKPGVTVRSGMEVCQIGRERERIFRGKDQKDLVFSR